MTRPPATLIRTGKCVVRCAARLPSLFRLARELSPAGFTAEQTSELDDVRRRIAAGLVRRLRREVATALGLRLGALRPKRFSAHGCGPVSLHDDKLRFPGVYFVIVVVHAGRLGIVDHRSRAARHAPGEILLLDPYLRHALVPAGRTAREHPYERTHSPVRDADDQFMFLCFDVMRPALRRRFLGGRHAPARGSAHRRRARE
ncbi:MAG TPA: hypothetical protein VJM14_11620 [Burkholderiales bacterium]|nr:hypothetical protein [Burkholderiales bacterium]